MAEDPNKAQDPRRTPGLVTSRRRVWTGGGTPPSEERDQRAIEDAKAEVSAMWPGGPDSEPLVMVPAAPGLFTDEQMRKLKDWEEEAPMVSRPATHSGGGFEDFLEKCQNGQGGEARQDREAHAGAGSAGGAGQRVHGHDSGNPGWGVRGAELQLRRDAEGHQGGQQMMRQGIGELQGDVPVMVAQEMAQIKDMMGQMMKYNQTLQIELNVCRQKINDLQSGGSAGQSDRFATPDGKPAAPEAEEASKAESSEELKRDEPAAGEPMEVMLKILHGMQQMQNKLIEQKSSGGSDVEMPKLPEYKPDTAAIDIGDWLCLLEPVVGDLSDTAYQWWTKLMEAARLWYQRYTAAVPLKRLEMSPVAPLDLCEGKWRRLERRVVSLLLGAIPEACKEEMVAVKAMTSYEIICRLMALYQPGSLAEKSVILRNLESPPEASDIAEAVKGLRRWIRWRRRAEENGVTIPDASVLARAVVKLIRKVTDHDKDLGFKVALTRNTLQLDSVPSHDTVMKFTEHILSEMESSAHMDSKHKVQPKAPVAEQLKAKKLEGAGEVKGEQKGMEEAKPCKFFLTDKGCRRGKSCKWSHNQKDEKMRCWACGASEHLRKDCPQAGIPSGDRKPKVAKAEAEIHRVDQVAITEPGKVDTTPRTPSSSASTNGTPDLRSRTPEAEPNAMQEALSEATKMLKSINVQNPGDARKVENELTLKDLQKQLDGMRERMRLNQITLKLSKVETGGGRGLVDSGATNPLRPLEEGEDISGYERREVELAAGETFPLSVTPAGTLVAPRGTQPIVPMGALVKVLGCRMSWAGGHCKIRHPVRGDLPVAMSQGCPELPIRTALELIGELEEAHRIKVRKLNTSDELEHVRKVIEEHPVFRDLPWHVKKELLVMPADDWKPLGLNRSRRRRLERMGGAVVHLFAGPQEGYDLSRAYKEQGGDPRDILEYDIVRGAEHDLLANELMSGLMRLALDGRLKALVGGPNCRTRSVLRFYPLENRDKPRPVRTLEKKWGLDDLDPQEEKIVVEDDILLFRFILLYVLADLKAKAEVKVEREGNVGFLLEQPAEPRAFWRTDEWRNLKKIHHLREITFKQGDWGGKAPKPTTVGTTMDVRLPQTGGGHIMEKDYGKPRWMMTDVEKLHPRSCRDGLRE